MRGREAPFSLWDWKQYQARGIPDLSSVQAVLRVAAYLETQLPKPEDMKPDAYKRNLAARAFDVAGHSAGSASMAGAELRRRDSRFPLRMAPTKLWRTKI